MYHIHVCTSVTEKLSGIFLGFKMFDNILTKSTVFAEYLESLKVMSTTAVEPKAELQSNITS